MTTIQLILFAITAGIFIAFYIICSIMRKDIENLHERIIELENGRSTLTIDYKELEAKIDSVVDLLYMLGIAEGRVKETAARIITTIHVGRNVEPLVEFLESDTFNKIMKEHRITQENNRHKETLKNLSKD